VRTGSEEGSDDERIEKYPASQRFRRNRTHDFRPRNQILSRRKPMKFEALNLQVGRPENESSDGEEDEERDKMPRFPHRRKRSPERDEGILAEMANGWNIGSGSPGCGAMAHPPEQQRKTGCPAPEWDTSALVDTLNSAECLEVLRDQCQHEDPIEPHPDDLVHLMPDLHPATHNSDTSDVRESTPKTPDSAQRRILLDALAMISVAPKATLVDNPDEAMLTHEQVSSMILNNMSNVAAVAGGVVPGISTRKSSLAVRERPGIGERVGQRAKMASRARRVREKKASRPKSGGGPEQNADSLGQWCHL
jgi:hypothetical protein